MSDDPASWGAKPVEDGPAAWGAKPSQPSMPDAGKLDAAGRGVAQGLTFGFSDELAGIHAAGGDGSEPSLTDRAISASPLGPAKELYRLGKGAAKYWTGDQEAERIYDETVKKEREATEAAKHNHPYIYGGSEIAGAVPSMVALPGGSVARGASFGAKMLKGAQVGAEYGALTGAGEGTDTGSRLAGAGVGSVVGGVGGSASPILGKALDYGYSKTLGPLVSTVRGWVNPEKEVASRAAGAIARDQELINAGKVEGMPLKEWDAAKAKGEPVILADAGAGNTQSLLRSAANTSPEGRSIIEKEVGDRFAGQSERVADDVRQLVSGGANARKTSDQLVTEYDAARVPAYKTAYEAGDRSIMNPTMERLMSSDTFVSAMKKAISTGRDRDVTMGFGGFNPAVNVTNDGRIVFNKGATGKPTYPNLQYWDQVKRELDAMSNMAKRSGDTSSSAGQLSKILRTELDKQVPAYKNARGVAEEFFGERDALEAGRKLAGKKVDPAELRGAIGKMSSQEQDLFREGYASDWADRVIKNISDSRDITKAMFNSPNERERARAVFGDSGMRKIEARMALEVTMDMARKALGNSTTARQLIEAGLAGGAVGGYFGGKEGAASGALTGAAGVLGAHKTALGQHVLSGAQKMIGYVDRNTARKVAEMLVSDDPNVLRQGISMAAKNSKIFEGLKRVANTVALGGEMAAAKPQLPKVYINTAEFSGSKNAQAEEERRRKGNNEPDQGAGGKSRGGSVHRSNGGPVRRALQSLKSYADGGAPDTDAEGMAPENYEQMGTIGRGIGHIAKRMFWDLPHEAVTAAKETPYGLRREDFTDLPPDTSPDPNSPLGGIGIQVPRGGGSHLDPMIAPSLEAGLNVMGGTSLSAPKGAVGAGPAVRAGVQAAPEKIVSAAINADGRIFGGAMHADALENAEKALGQPKSISEGFITSTGRYVDRAEAQKIAESHNQIDSMIGQPGQEKLYADELKAWDDPDITRNIAAIKRAESVRPQDTGSYNGKKFWSGAFDPRDGHIIETHPYSKAEKSDFHHSFYFSDKAQDAMKNGEAQFFWMDKNGVPQTEWREGAAKPDIARALAEKVSSKRKDVTFGAGAADNRGAVAAAAPIWRSAVEDAIETLPMKAAPADQWANTLRNAKGIKPEEMDWLGLQDFFAAKKAAGEKVTKQEVLDHVAGNKVELKDVVRGGPVETHGYEVVPHPTEEGFALRNQQGNYKLAPEDYRNPGSVLRWETEDLARNGGLSMYDKTYPTKYHSYQLPGGENYREHLLTMPDNRLQLKQLGSGRFAIRDTEANQFIRDASGGGRSFATAAEARAEIQHLNNVGRESSTSYKSPHWDEPNVLAHVRSNDRVMESPEGPKKTLHLEEIQSDWHQKGRKEGYAQKYKPEELSMASTAEMTDPQRFWYVKAPDNVFQIPKVKAPTFEDAKNYIVAEKNKGAGSIPNAPFKDTDAWAGLAMKRMIREAAEKGYDRVSWTPGEAQAARYDLSKQVDSLLYKKNPDGTFKVSAQIGGRGEMLGDKLTDSQLADHVGKDVAEKIVKGEGKKENLGGSSSSTPPDHWNNLSGVDLKVGGEGMREFYDKMLPKIAEKIGKAHGVKVKQGHIGSTEVPKNFDIEHTGSGWRVVDMSQNQGQGTFIGPIHRSGGDAEKWLQQQGHMKQPIHYFDITPSMKEQALKGFSAFKKGGRVTLGKQRSRDAGLKAAYQSKRSGTQ